MVSCDTQIQVWPMVSKNLDQAVLKHFTSMNYNYSARSNSQTALYLQS